MQKIIFIVNINPPEYSRFCIDSWKKWSEKNNCKVVVLDEPFSSFDPHWYKTYVFELLENSSIEYDQVAVVDNDTIINPSCPNFFELVPENKIGVVLDDVNFDWTIRSTDAYHKHVFTDFKRFDTFEYFNSGFIVLSKKHKLSYDKVLEFFSSNVTQLDWVQRNYGVGRDQTPLNFLLREYSDGLHFLSKKFNLQGLLSKEITDPKMLSEMGYIFHFNAMPRDYRGELMKKVYSYLYE